MNAVAEIAYWCALRVRPALSRSILKRSVRETMRSVACGLNLTHAWKSPVHWCWPTKGRERQLQNHSNLNSWTWSHGHSHQQHSDMPFPNQQSTNRTSIRSHKLLEPWGHAGKWAANSHEPAQRSQKSASVVWAFCGPSSHPMVLQPATAAAAPASPPQVNSSLWISIPDARWFTFNSQLDWRSFWEESEESPTQLYLLGVKSAKGRHKFFQKEPSPITVTHQASHAPK